MACLLPVTPFVGVWIETYVRRRSGGTGRSHPSWVCGLKHDTRPDHRCAIPSHPSWVCGLKLSALVNRTSENRHTLRGCVD